MYYINAAQINTMYMYTFIYVWYEYIYSVYTTQIYTINMFTFVNEMYEYIHSVYRVCGYVY